MRCGTRSKRLAVACELNVISEKHYQRMTHLLLLSFFYEDRNEDEEGEVEGEC